MKYKIKYDDVFFFLNEVQSQIKHNQTKEIGHISESRGHDA